MNESRRAIDARGLACPEPVIRTKKALEDGGFDFLEVTVDNPAAKENVTRFAAWSGCQAEAEETGEGTWKIIIPTKAIGPQGLPLPEEDCGDQSTEVEPQGQVAKESAAGATVLISSDCLGKGEAELGALLMKGFIYALAEAEQAPKRIIFMNSGVRLVIAPSETTKHLLRLAEGGVEILVCGTCLDYHGFKGRLAVGRISNMYEIASLLLEGRTFSV